MPDEQKAHLPAFSNRPWEVIDPDPGHGESAIRAWGHVRRLHSDLTETQIRLAEERHKASHDKLTGLLNLNGLMEELNDLVDDRPGEFSVSFVDLDGLKRINDTQGHAKGNELICSAAQVLENTLRTDNKEAYEERRTDSKAGADIVTAARIGGDEFVVILMGVNSPEDLLKVQQRMKDNLQLEGISASLDGLTHRKGMSAKELLNEADQMMLAKKREGKRIAERAQPLPHRLAARLGRRLLKSAGQHDSRLN